MTTRADTLVDRYLTELEAELAGLGGLTMSARGSTAVGSGPLGPTETSLLEVVVFVVPFLLPIAAAIYLAVRLRSLTGKEQRAAARR